LIETNIPTQRGKNKEMKKQNKTQNENMIESQKGKTTANMKVIYTGVCNLFFVYHVCLLRFCGFPLTKAHHPSAVGRIKQKKQRNIRNIRCEKRLNNKNAKFMNHQPTVQVVPYAIDIN
jgi:hypothetical protein